MPIDGSLTSNIERQSFGDPLPDRTGTRRQHGANVVNRAFSQSATPVGNPENILGALLEASGHVATAAGQEVARRVEEDKTIQTSRFYEGMASTDEATVAGYRTHAVLSMSNKVLNSTATLKHEAETFTGTDGEWEQKIRIAQSGDHAALMEEYPQLKNDPLAGKSIVAMYGEQVPAIAAARLGFKLKQEHEGRLVTFGESIRVRTEGLKQEESDAVVKGLMEVDSLGLTVKEQEAMLFTKATATAETGDLTLIRSVEKYLGKRGLTPVLQKAKEAGEQVYWKNNQEVIAYAKDGLQKRVLAGEFEGNDAGLFKAAGDLDRLVDGNAYSTEGISALVKLSQKEPPDPALLHVADDAAAALKVKRSVSAGASEKDVLAAAQAANDDTLAYGEKGRVVVSKSEVMGWLEERANKKAAEVKTSGLLAEFSQRDKGDKIPIGWQGHTTAEVNLLMVEARMLSERTVNNAIARLPKGHTAADEQIVRDRAEVVYINQLSEERVTDPAFKDRFASIATIDMSDSKNMKSLHPAVEKLFVSFESMSEGAKSLHAEPDIRAIYENFKGFTKDGIGRVAAFEMALHQKKSPRNLTTADHKAIAKAGNKFSGNAAWGKLPFTDANAEGWYRDKLNADATARITKLMLGGVVSVGQAKEMDAEAFAVSHTKLKNGKYLAGTAPMLARQLGIRSEDFSENIDLFLEMNKDHFEDTANVPIKEMYIDVDPQRETFVVRSSIADSAVTRPAPLSGLMQGVNTFRNSKKKREAEIKKKYGNVSFAGQETTGWKDEKFR